MIHQCKFYERRDIIALNLFGGVGLRSQYFLACLSKTHNNSTSTTTQSAQQTNTNGHETLLGDECGCLALCLIDVLARAVAQIGQSCMAFDLTDKDDDKNLSLADSAPSCKIQHQRQQHSLDRSITTTSPRPRPNNATTSIPRPRRRRRRCSECRRRARPPIAPCAPISPGVDPSVD